MTLPTLHNTDLLRTQWLIGGQWVPALTEDLFTVINPTTQATLCTLSSCGAHEANLAIDCASKALEDWKHTPARKRAELLYQWFELIHEHLDDLALLLHAEQGKPLEEAKGELLYGASFVRWYAAEAERNYGRTIPSPHSDKRFFTFQRPVGVCAAITPWNFPSAMITRKIAPALAAGCTVVLKPSEETPLSALALAYLTLEAGIPSGVFNVIGGQAEDIGLALTESPTVRKLSFTGSTRVGKRLMSQSAAHVKKLSLELGGNAAFLVFEDASLPQTITALQQAKFRSSGQSCVAANRIFIHESLYSSFPEAFAASLDSIQCGPLINQKALEKVQRLIGDAVEKGAQILLGGEVESGTLFPPTVLADCTPEMDIFHEEIFGPIAAMGSFSSEEEAVQLANGTPYGLAHYVMTQDMQRIWRLSEQLESGLLAFNTGLLSDPACPFGGVKCSGIGKEGGREGIEEYLETQYVCLGMD